MHKVHLFERLIFDILNIAKKLGVPLFRFYGIKVE
jgi:hypothetical protein